MPKLGTYGSVRGALSNGRPYRDCASKSSGLDAAGAAKCIAWRTARRLGQAHAVLERNHARK